MARIEVRCPSCSKKGHIDFSDDLMKNVTRGVLAVHVAEKNICEHSFIAYVDKNLAVRDYFMADFAIELPEIIPKQEVEEKKVPTRDIVDIDLIKMNVSASTLTFVLKSIFYKQKAVIISDQTFLYNHILNFLEYITQNSFDIDISILSIVDYMKNKKKYKKALVFGNNEVLKDVNKIIDPKRLKIEKKIVEKFFAESESTSSLIILKNEVQKTYELAKNMMEFIKNYDGKERLNSKKVFDYLKEIHKVKIPFQYLNFLSEIVEKYFELKVPKSSEISDFLEFL